MESTGAPINVGDYERLAEEALDEGSFGYFAGGAGDEHTVRHNREAFDGWRLRPRMLVDVSSVSTATTILGHEVAMPILTAPVAYQRMAHPDGEAAVARAAAAAGTVMCLSTFSTTGLTEVAEAAPDAQRWFQLYWHPDREVTRALLDQARHAGFSAVVFTVDVPVLGRRERDLRTGFQLGPGIGIRAYGSLLGDLGALTPALAAELIDPRLSWRDLDWLHEAAGMPVVAKGILTAEDAVLAADHGCAAVVVSNHGGRQLDRSVASLDALPEVVEAVGDRVEVLMDSGVRRGTEAAIALALGARAVLVGRPVVWGLAVDGEAGVRHVLELLRDELAQALALLGCPTPGHVGREHVIRAS
ncbi:MAG TPA: alpha-hydroxy acid oxidase [Gaiellaceae bacterium]|nr:alpha-hydroxy acid oxidase [Gaiellaceae bacterium]HET8653051.1 alpha-hydroxy acid oxidase [Gaiellaceae bacterium]